MCDNSCLLYISLDSSLELQTSGGQSFHFAPLSNDFDCGVSVVCSCVWHEHILKGARRLLIVV